jgi:hypothetical protein
MKLSTIYRSLLAAAVFAAAGVAPALAVTTAGGETFAPYVAAFTPTFGPSGVPYAGTMQLLIHEGTVEGTYTGISVRPDRFDDRIVPVTGTVSTNDRYVQLFIGNSLSFRGTGRGRNDLGNGNLQRAALRLHGQTRLAGTSLTRSRVSALSQLMLAAPTP